MKYHEVSRTYVIRTHLKIMLVNSCTSHEVSWSITYVCYTYSLRIMLVYSCTFVQIQSKVYTHTEYGCIFDGVPAKKYWIYTVCIYIWFWPAPCMYEWSWPNLFVWMCVCVYVCVWVRVRFCARVVDWSSINAWAGTVFYNMLMQNGEVCMHAWLAQAYPTHASLTPQWVRMKLWS
jgi:hypothetical protein